jgi:hypothetical protein
VEAVGGSCLDLVVWEDLRGMNQDQKPSRSWLVTEGAERKSPRLSSLGTDVTVGYSEQPGKW